MGGWTFSTEPATYMVFRNGVQPANRETMAKKIADFVLEHDLDGIDIDWEYPGAPDIPNIPPGKENEGNLYTAFLALLKSKLPGKSISIAAPASYWYLKAYPVEKMTDLLDYVVFMAYDLHGQWDFSNQWSSGCPEGNCLRSHINLTETQNALSIVTKTGATSNKLIVGEASGARKGWCPDEAGYISNGEIQEILDNNTNARTFLDNSFSSILVYNETEWVAYSNDANRKQRETLFQGLNMGGLVEWAVDLQTFHDVPSDAVEVVDRVSVPITMWAQFYELIDEGNDPYTWGTRTGNWTDLNCDDDADAIRTYKNDYKPNGLRFTESVFDFFNAEEQECGLLTEEADGDDALSCPDTQGSGSGPAGWEVLSSLVKINAMFKDYYQAIEDAGSDINEPEKAQEFVDTFAPVKDHTTAFNVLMDILGIVVPSAMAPAINSVLRNTAYFTRNPNKLDTAKDITYTLVAGWVNLAKDTNPEDYDWDDDDAAAFKLQMSKTFDLWELSAGSAAEELFNGSDKSIATLTKAIKDGQLIDGLIGEGTTQLPRYSRREMEDLIKASFFSYAIPQVWQESSRSVFWLDTDGHPCDDDSNPVSDYIFDATAEATKACYQGKTYYLVYPEGTASNTCQTPGGGQGTCRPYRFDAPPGVEMTQNYGVLLDDMLASSIHSYNENKWQERLGPEGSLQA
ncbi:glycoside hydrolase superfamily [Aspergillus falconensis]